MATVRGADLILANSHYTLARAEEVIGGLPQAQVCWLGTEQEEEAVTAPLQERPPALLFLGRSDDLFAKGQDILIDTWPDVISKVPAAKLIFAGGYELWNRAVRSRSGLCGSDAPRGPSTRFDRRRLAGGQPGWRDGLQCIEIRPVWDH